MSRYFEYVKTSCWATIHGMAWQLHKDFTENRRYYNDKKTYRNRLLHCFQLNIPCCWTRTPVPGNES